MLARCARCQGTFTTDHYGRQTCPHCGSELLLADPNQPPPQPPPAPEAFAPPPPSGGGWSPPPAPPPPSAPEPDLPSPFAERSSRGFFRAFFETWKLVATEPQKFFGRVRTDQVGTAMLFGVLAAWAGGLIGSLVGLATNQAQLAQARQSIEQLPPEMRWMADALSRYLDYATSGWYVAGEALAIPILTLLKMLVIAALAHVFLLMFRGAGRGFSATLTVVAFSYGLDLLDAVPGCGGLIAFIWRAVLLIIGLAAIHRTEVWRSVLAVLLPAFLACCCCIGSFATFVGSLASHFSQGGMTEL